MQDLMEERSRLPSISEEEATWEKGEHKFDKLDEDS
jgi:hypothetical protein